MNKIHNPGRFLAVTLPKRSGNQAGIDDKRSSLQVNKRIERTRSLRAWALTNRGLLSGLLLAALFLAAMAWVQFSTPDMPDNDGYYHIKLAAIMRAEGLKPDFPWLPLSILGPREFYDHHFLFHVALIPFTFGDLRVGAKWAAVVFSTLAFLSVWWLFYRQRIPYASLWALGLLAVSDAFLFRMSITRAQSLSLAVLALGLLWLLEGRHKRLLLLGFVYVWLYDAFPLLLILAGAYFLATWVLERRFNLRPLLYVGLGIGLGLVINPYFPYNILFAYRHILPKLVETTAVSVGNEWFPYDTSQLLENSPLALVAFLSGTLALGLSGRRMDARTGAAFFLATLFGLMLFQARRFVEYFPPFALIFAAFAWAPLLERQVTGGSAIHRWRPGLKAGLISAALALVLVIGGYASLQRAQASVQNAKDYQTYAGASAWLAANTPAGARIFQTDWDDFPRLFFYNTHNTYLIGLDPTYMQIYDPDLYDLCVKITRGQVERPSEVFYERFGTQYVLSDLNHGDFLRQAKDDPGLEEVYRDRYAVIYKIP